MAVIAQTNINQIGDFAATITTLTASDTLIYKSGSLQTLILRNPTAGSLTVTLDGDQSTTVSVSGMGDVSVSAGKSITVAAGATRAVRLDTIAAYLKGTVAVTGGTGLEAILLTA